MTTTELKVITKIGVSDSFIGWLAIAIEQRTIAVVDKQLMQFLMRFISEELCQSERDELAIFLCYLSYKMAQGDVCLRLEKTMRASYLPAYFSSLPVALQSLLASSTQDAFIKLLVKSKLAFHAQDDTLLLQTINIADEIPPIMIVGNRVYWQRMWEDEHRIANYLVTQSKKVLSPEIGILKPILDSTFGVNNGVLDRQKVSAAIALSKSISIISGGPGTGKTTTVAAILLTALRLNPKKRLRILLAAPTGKAAARLTESLLQARDRLQPSAQEQEQLALEAVTLHRLLGASPRGDGFRHHQTNPLHGDILVVDEASMIDLRLMSALIDALPPSMRIILLGDKDQLSSVAPGRVLGDICSFGELTFSQGNAAHLAELIGVPVSQLYDPSLKHSSTVSDVIGLLTLSRRFTAESEIGQLAMAINKQKRRDVETLLLNNQCEYEASTLTFNRQTSELRYIAFTHNDDYSQTQCYEALLNDCVAGFSTYLNKVSAFNQLDYADDTTEYNTAEKPKVDPDMAIVTEEDLDDSEQQKIIDILAVFNQFRVLASIHSGIFGTDGLNEQLILRLQEMRRLPRSRDKHFIGRPILITRNDAALRLFNGDIGVTLRDKNTGQMRVYFLNPTGLLQSVVPSRLPEHETAFVMTVHKSQGSEFDHTLMVLPDTLNPVLTKELIYTGVTRAKTQITIYGTMDIVQAAIRQLTPRSSGLVDQITALERIESE